MNPRTQDKRKGNVHELEGIVSFTIKFVHLSYANGYSLSQKEAEQSCIMTPTIPENLVIPLNFQKTEISQHAIKPINDTTNKA